jgi:shikimate kinase
LYLAALMNVYLTGYMACGKSSIGRLLAQQLGIAFYDLDEQIVVLYGQSVAAIFDEEGEDAFRQKEAIVLRSLPAQANAIIALGGGTFCFRENREWISTQGISVYLEVSTKKLHQRLSAQAVHRPIIKANNHSAEALMDFIKTHLASRQQDYEQADIIYQADGKVEDIVQELANYFYRFLKN